MKGAVEIPHDWRAPRHWPGSRVDNDAADAIARLLNDVRPAGLDICCRRPRGTLDEPASRVQGHTVPVTHWDAAMREPCGTWWDHQHGADILATAARLNEGKAALLRRIGPALWGDNWHGDMARALKVRRGHRGRMGERQDRHTGWRDG